MTTKRVLFFIAAPSLLLAETTLAAKINPLLPGPHSVAAAGPVAIVANVYEFAFLLGGLLAFGSILYGAIKYIISRGNPSGQSDAKDAITQAFLGLLLLLGAYLILATVNPDLVTLKLPTLEPLKERPASTTGGPVCGGSTPGKCPEGATCKLTGTGTYECVAEVACDNLPALAESYSVPHPARNDSRLSALISCIRSRPEVRGINLGSEYTYDVSYDACNYTRGERRCTQECSHRIHSCHYGGTGGTQGALAVDFGLGAGAVPREAEQALRAAATACDSGVYVLNEGDHIHISHSACGAQ